MKRKESARDRYNAAYQKTSRDMRILHQTYVDRGDHEMANAIFIDFINASEELFRTYAEERAEEEE